MIRKRVNEIQAQAQSEKEWWERKKASIQSDFMKELEDEKSAAAAPVGKGSDDDAVLVESGGPAVNQQGSMKGKKKGKK